MNLVPPELAVSREARETTVHPARPVTKDLSAFPVHQAAMVSLDSVDSRVFTEKRETREYEASPDHLDPVACK